MSAGWHEKGIDTEDKSPSAGHNKRSSSGHPQSEAMIGLRFEKCNDLFQAPNMIGHARFHCGS